jgi:hypothetical protein
MALVVKNRVKETTSTTGTGTLTLAGAVTGFQAFSSALSNNDTTYYSLIESSTGSFEVGIGTFTASGTTLARTTILASSNSNNAINLTASNAEVFITQPAEKAVFFDASGDVTLIRNPQSALQAATKQYVDTIAAAGLHYHAPVRVQTTGNLNATYSNGSSGVGATLTNAGTQAAISIDGVTLSSADRVLVSEQTNAAHNGIYTVTTVGTASSNFVLTRATDADSYGPSDPDAFGQGDAFFIKEGNTNAGHLDVMNTSGAITFGTTNIVFAEVAETTVYSAGNGLTLSGTTFAAGAGTGVTVNTNDIAIGQDVATTASPTFNTVTASLTGNVTGNVTGDVTGNADTATAWETARTISLTGDVTGSATGVDGSGNVSITTTYNNDVVLGTDTSGNYIATGAVSGNGLSGSAGAEGATFTVTSNATNSNTASTIVFRDGSGDFSAGTITANLSGVATNATNANSALTAATVTTAAQPNITSLGTLTTLTVDDITINGSTISDGGDFTLDVGGVISLDANGGNIRFKNNGTQFGTIYQSSSHLVFQSDTSDGDIILQGKDGSSYVNALTLDMSDAGTATFNHDIKLGDTSKALFGAGSDVEIFSDGTNGVVRQANNSGNLYIQADGYVSLGEVGNINPMLRAHKDGAVDLYYDYSSHNTAKLSTTATGVSINGDNYISMQENHFINRRFEMDAADNASPVYILLCLNAGSNDVNGTITMDRTSALKHACSWNMIVSSGSSTAPIGSLMGHGVAHAGQPSARLVTLTYSSVSYVALEITNPDAYHETTGAYFNGRIVNSGSNTLTPKIASAVTSVSALAQGNSKAVIGNTLSVGDITISGSTISDAGDLTFDVGGDIILDADGSYIYFKDGGTQFGKIANGGSNVELHSNAHLSLRPNNGTSATSNTVWNQGNVVPWANDYFTLGNSSYGWQNLWLSSGIYHQGDDDTYLQFDAANSFRIVTGNSQRVKVDSSGVQLGDNGNGYFQPVSGDYGSIQIDGGAHTGYEGYSIGGRIVFMHDNSTTSYLFNDVENEAFIKMTNNGAVDLYYNGAITFSTVSGGAAAAGTLTATGDITAYYSDERLKDFEGKIDGALDKVSKLNGYYFRENDKAKELGYDNDALQVGVSAQEVEAVMPEVVKPAPVDPEYKTIQYEKLVPLLIEAIKELKEEVRQLKEDKA